MPGHASTVVKLKTSRPVAPRPGMDGFQATGAWGLSFAAGDGESAQAACAELSGELQPARRVQSRRKMHLARQWSRGLEVHLEFYGSRPGFRCRGRCDAGYSGPACEAFCPNSCSGQGRCIEGGCLCFAGFAGTDCSVQQCCNGHGTCEVWLACWTHAGRKVSRPAGAWHVRLRCRLGRPCHSKLALSLEAC